MSYQLPTPQRTIQRPLEFDPTLLNRTTNQFKQSRSITTQLNEFGFDDDNEDIHNDKSFDHHNDEKSNEYDSMNDTKYQLLQQQLQSTQSQYTELQSQHKTLQSQLESSESANHEYIIRIDELKKISTHSKSIIINKFKQQIKSLMNTIDEQKSLIRDDEQHIQLLVAQLQQNHNISDHMYNNNNSNNNALINENNILKLELRECNTKLIELHSEFDLYKLHQSTTDGHMNDITMVEQSSHQIAASELQLQPSQSAIIPCSIEPSQQINTAELDRLQMQHNNVLTQLDQQTQQYNELKQSTESTINTLTQQLRTVQQQYDTAQESIQNHQLVIQRDTAESQAETTKIHTEQKQRITELEHELVQLTNTVSELNNTITGRDSEIQLIRDKAKDKLIQASENIKLLKHEYSILRDTYKSTRSQQTIQQQKYTALQQSIHALKSQYHTLVKQYQQSWHTLQYDQLMQQFVNKLQQSTQQRISTLECNYASEMKLRRQYFNQLQELRGNIRVYLRIRPSNTGQASSIHTVDTQALTITSDKQNHINFEFDHIFNTNSTQVEVYSQVSDLVLSVLDGYNVCIFAYGQTGAGKTYTMQGSTSDPGINVRTLTQLFDTINSRNEIWTYNISVSLLEIYNEQIRDLLANTDEQLKARESSRGSIEVPGLTQVPVDTSSAVLHQLSDGSKNRYVRRTDMNDLSSRSHLILSIYIHAVNKLNNKEISSKLHLIDLAGSERISRSGVTGDALSEAKSINLSLSSLGNVISSRVNKSSHIPYRDSTLTWLLKDSLEKNSKTLVVCQISPDINDQNESICSLKFASRAREVELGKATVNLQKPIPASAIKRSTSKLSDNGS